ncbi:kinase-like protein [Xylaria bambusicola]|uniref:kinase-like protein n=1 Tax=Xylaria bambusicola TaxID=326684 RepID=UPI002007C9CE|nr:kinase-like protein [Xylaria bambusicola]KAI0505812.1 kinase-like protein [Xylaria bambusicola]
MADLSRQYSSQSSQHSSPSVYDSPKSGLYSILRSRLVACDRTDEAQHFSRFSFLPLSAIDEVVTTDVVKTVSGNRGWFTWRRGEDYSQMAKQAKKVFAILGFFEAPTLISTLFEDGLRDKHLPLTRVERSRVLVGSRGREFTSFQKLSDMDVENFLRCQWYALAPVFTALSSDVHVDREICVTKDNPLPFFDVKKISSIPGRSTVYQGTLHAAHIKPRPDEHVKIAIKDFTDKTDFDKEKGNLVKIQKLNHPHLIRQIATIEQGKSYYIIFPWASGGNLSDFWKSPRTPETEYLKPLTWCLEQMFGLADALFALHHKLGDHKLDGMHCRHGDLKPENILYFDGTLVIADVGVSKVHVLGTDLRHDPTNTKATTPCYEPPEAETDTKRPRRYDMWSLGCIFMEFIIWLLEGYGAIEDFKKQRRGNDDPFPQKGAYYQHNKPEPAIVHPVVTAKIEALRQHPRCTSQLTSLLKLISEDLIVVDPLKRAEAGELRDKLRGIVRQRTGKDPG